MPRQTFPGVPARRQPREHSDPACVDGGMRAAPFALSCVLAGCVAAGVEGRRSEDPWAIYRRDRELYRAWMGETAPVPANRRERRAMIEEERKLERACREGQERADAEIRAGQLGELGFGLPSDCWLVARERAERELGIRVRTMGCVVGGENEAMVSCYNTTMAREIEARRLDDDFERIFAEVCGD